MEGRRERDCGDRASGERGIGIGRGRRDESEGKIEASRKADLKLGLRRGSGGKRGFEGIESTAQHAGCIVTTSCPFLYN